MKLKIRIKIGYFYFILTSPINFMVNILTFNKIKELRCTQIENSDKNWILFKII